MQTIPTFESGAHHARYHPAILQVFCMLAAALLLSPLTVSAKTVVGSVAGLTGSAEIHYHQETGKPESIQAAASGMPIHAGDVIHTAAGSRLQLVMGDGGKIALGPKTVFAVDEYGFDPDAGAGRVLMRLLEGAFRAASGRLNTLSDSNFSVATPRGTIGVRGTEFWGGFLEHDGAMKFGVLMLEGTGVEVITTSGTAVLDAPGEGAWLAADGHLVKQDTWSDEMVRLAASITGPMP